MSGIKITWDVGEFNPDKHYIYRSASPISPNNLPTPIAEVGQGISEYNDLSIVDGETYHYFVAADKMGLLCPADSGVRVFTFFPPGPSVIIAGDSTNGFYGEASASEIINGPDLSTLLNLSSGTHINIDEPWLKFAHQGRILYIAKKNLKSGVNWGSIPSPQSVEIDGYNYIARIIYDGSDYSEWNELLYKIHVNDPTNTNWWNYTNADLEVGLSISRTATFVNPTTNRYRGWSSLTQAGTSTSGNGWRPVLELQS